MNIAEFARRCGLTPHTLRYYERIGLLGRVSRLDNGHRQFGAADVEWVGFLKRLRATLELATVGWRRRVDAAVQPGRTTSSARSSPPSVMETIACSRTLGLAW